MDQEITFTAFAGNRRIAFGTLREVLPVLKRRFDADGSDMVLVFDDATGKQVDFDLRGTLEEVLEREVPPVSRGPGRPKLGVVSREVSLLPRHWDWLEQQPNGISAALRRLVEQAAKSEPAKERARRQRDALFRFMSAIGGNLPSFEEASRALYASDQERLGQVIRKWPKDVRDYVAEKAHEVASAESAT